MTPANLRWLVAWLISTTLALVALTARVYSDHRIAWTGEYGEAGEQLAYFLRHNPDPTQPIIRVAVFNKIDEMTGPEAEINRQEWRRWLRINP